MKHFIELLQYSILLYFTYCPNTLAYSKYYQSFLDVKTDQTKNITPSLESNQNYLDNISGSINSSIQSYFTNTNNLSEKRIEPQNIIENQTQIDGYDGILIKDLPQQNYPQFSEMNSSNKVENSMLGKSLFSNSVQNDLFSSLNEGKNQKIINDNPNLNPENFDEINKKLDNLTHILEGLMKDKNNEEDKLIEKNTQKIKNETVFELKKNELQIERLEDFDSRLEKLKKSIEEETYNNNDLEVDFF